MSDSNEKTEQVRLTAEMQKDLRDGKSLKEISETYNLSHEQLQTLADKMIDEKTVPDQPRPQADLALGESGFVDDEIRSWRGIWKAIIFSLVACGVLIGLTWRWVSSKPSSVETAPSIPVVAIPIADAGTAASRYEADMLDELRRKAAEEETRVEVKKALPITVRPAERPVSHVDAGKPKELSVTSKKEASAEVKKGFEKKHEPEPQPAPAKINYWSICMAKFESSIRECVARGPGWRKCCLPPPPGKEDPVFRCRAETCEE